MRVWAAPLAMMAASGLAVAGLRFAPPAAGPVALVFPPWWTTDQVTAAAFRAGRPIRLGGVRFVVVVQRDAAATGAAGLWRIGAWFALDPRLLGCGPGRVTR